MSMNDTITIAFIKRNGTFVPSHMSDIKSGDHFYLVSDGKPSTHQMASSDAHLDKDNQWSVDSVEQSKK